MLHRMYDDGTIIAADSEYEVGRDGELCLPCSPAAVYCVGRNYAGTLEQMEYERPDEPDFFIKSPTAVVGPNDPVLYPDWTDKLTYAGELAAVIGRRCHDILQEAVPDIISGYMILNNIDALDQPGRTARKAFTGSAPVGPWIETGIDPGRINMQTLVSGELRQDANTTQILFDPNEVISFLSRWVTFRPSDVVSFGSPANPGVVEPGDTVAITYEGIGTLKNTIVAER